MKRALAIAVAVCTLGVAGFSQIGAITGSWATTVRILPAVELRSSVLTLTTTIAGLGVTSTTTFGDTDEVAGGVQIGFREQAFSVRGAVGPFTITGAMAFNAGVTRIRHWYCDAPNPFAPGTWRSYDYTVTTPAYRSASLASAFDFGGISISAKVDHWAFPYYAELGGWPCEEQTGSYMLYTLGATISPVTITGRFDDCCGGIEFRDLTLGLKGLGLCCGITYDVAFSFNKDGFDYISFAVKDVFALGGGLGFDLNVKFTTTSKEVTLTPKLPWLTGCISVWGDLAIEEMSIEGLTIYGYRISCTIADCGLLEFMTVLEMPPVVPGTCDQPAWYTAAGFRPGGWEYQYLRFRFCGAGCCGGTWTVTSTAYFATPGAIQGGLFDLSRLHVTASVPVMANLTLSLTANLPMDPDVVVATGLTAGQFLFDLGFRFTF